MGWGGTETPKDAHTQEFTRHQGTDAEHRGYGQHQSLPTDFGYFILAAPEDSRLTSWFLCCMDGIWTCLPKRNELVSLWISLLEHHLHPPPVPLPATTV